MLLDTNACVGFLHNDSLICNDATLATGNVKHFSRFEGLKLQNWFRVEAEERRRQ